jgi:glutathione synthase
VKPHLLWITDPWDTLDHPRETTLRLMQEASSLGANQAWADVKTIRLENGKIQLDALPLLSVESTISRDSFRWGATEIKSPKEFTSLHYRTDPPVNEAYLHPLQLLAAELIDHPSCEVVNPFEVLFALNEKTEAFALGDLMPSSVVASQWERLSKFGKTQRLTVLKPLHLSESRGIKLIKWETSADIEEAKKQLAIATQQFKTPVILQTYLPGIAEGETRLWFLDGELLACVQKFPIPGDFLVDVDRGSQLKPVTLSEPILKKVEKISKHLKKRKIRLAAIDLIEGYLTDFNFTSPGLITQMEKVLGENLALPIVKHLLAQ